MISAEQIRKNKKEIFEKRYSEIHKMMNKYLYEAIDKIYIGDINDLDKTYTIFKINECPCTNASHYREGYYCSQNHYTEGVIQKCIEIWTFDKFREIIGNMAKEILQPVGFKVIIKQNSWYESKYISIDITFPKESVLPADKDCCPICMENSKEITLVCGHTDLCKGCYHHPRFNKKCPTCQTSIE